jgi:hypothetical protein
MFLVTVNEKDLDFFDHARIHKDFLILVSDIRSNSDTKDTKKFKQKGE